MCRLYELAIHASAEPPDIYEIFYVMCSHAENSAPKIEQSPMAVRRSLTYARLAINLCACYTSVVPAHDCALQEGHRMGFTEYKEASQLRYGEFAKAISG